MKLTFHVHSNPIQSPVLLLYLLSQWWHDILIQMLSLCAIIAAHERSAGQDWTLPCTETLLPPPCCALLDTRCDSQNAIGFPVAGFVASALCFPASSMFRININEVYHWLSVGFHLEELLCTHHKFPHSTMLC